MYPSFVETSVHSEVCFFAEQPYDSIPNFTAADILRLTGIGRNEFIDIMNKCRAKVKPLRLSYWATYLLVFYIARILNVMFTLSSDLYRDALFPKYRSILYIF